MPIKTSSTSKTCDKCGHTAYESTTTYICDTCGKEIVIDKKEKATVLHLAQFWDICIPSKETTYLYFCTWYCLFKKLWEIEHLSKDDIHKPDYFIALSEIHYDSEHPELSHRGFWNDMFKFAKALALTTLHNEKKKIHNYGPTHP